MARRGVERTSRRYCRPASVALVGGKPADDADHFGSTPTVLIPSRRTLLGARWGKPFGTALRRRLNQRRSLGGCPLRHGFSESPLLLEQHGLSLSDQDVGSVAELLGLFHEALRRLPHRLRHESYFRGQHRAAEEMCTNGFSEVLTTSRAHVR